MLEKDRINLYRAIFYIVVVLSIPVVAYKDYQHWLNPLNLKPEENPKQHDGSQEFTPPRDFESSIQPMPDEDGVRRYLDPWELWQHGQDPEPDEEASPDKKKDITVVPNLGIDH